MEIKTRLLTHGKGNRSSFGTTGAQEEAPKLLNPLTYHEQAIVISESPSVVSRACGPRSPFYRFSKVESIQGVFYCCIGMDFSSSFKGRQSGWREEPDSPRRIGETWRRRGGMETTIHFDSNPPNATTFSISNQRRSNWRRWGLAVFLFSSCVPTTS